VAFTQPIDPASLTLGNGVQLYNVGTGSTGQATPLSLVSISPDQTTVTLEPDGNLVADTQYQLRINYGGTVYDATGLPIYYSAYYSFSTGNAVTASGNPLPVYGTGLGTGGVGALAAGASDPNWTASNPNSCCLYSGPATVLSAANLYSTWNADDSNSQWISWADTSAGGPPGYSFTQTFDLSGFDPTTAAISGTLWADDGAYIYLNGIQLAYANNNSWESTGAPGVSFSVGPNSTLFLPGVNTLTVVMSSADSSYDGARVRINSATAAPKSGQNLRSHNAIYASNRVPTGSGQVYRPVPRSVLDPWDASDWLAGFAPIALGSRAQPQSQKPPAVLLNLVPLDRLPLPDYHHATGEPVALARLAGEPQPPR